MSARRKRVISTEEIQFNHKPAKMLLTDKKKGVIQNGQTPSIIGICSYCALDRPVFERCQTLLHPELTPWWSFLLADGAHHKKPHSPTHPTLKLEHSLVITSREDIMGCNSWSMPCNRDSFWFCCHSSCHSSLNNFRWIWKWYGFTQVECYLVHFQEIYFTSTGTIAPVQRD